MAEARRPAGEREVEQALFDLGPRVSFPPTPMLTVAVRDRIAGAPGRRPRAAWWTPARAWQTAALAALALALLGGTVLLLSRTARDAVADLLGIGGVEIRYVPEDPTATPSPMESPAGASLRLGARVTLDEARARLPFPMVMPALPEIGAPDEVYAGESGSRGELWMLYRPRPGLPSTPETGVGLLFSQARGVLSGNLFGKGVGPGARLEAVTVNGASGVWIEGAPHFFFYLDERGQAREERSRIAGNTLLWERNGVTYRLESALGRDQAIRIGESVR